MILALLAQVATNCTFYFGQMQCVTTPPPVISAPPNPNVMFSQPNAGATFAQGFERAQQQKVDQELAHALACREMYRRALAGEGPMPSQEAIAACKQ